MDNILTYIHNKCKQYVNRIFFIYFNNSGMIHYASLLSAISALDRFVTTKIRNEEPSIVLISRNILFKTIVFLYSFFSGTKLIMISPKFTMSETLAMMMSKRPVNILFIDRDILSEIERLEVEEDINILDFFTCIETSTKMVEFLTELNTTEPAIINKVVAIGRRKHLNNEESFVSVPSPGTTSASSITNIPYTLLGKSMLALSFFMGLKPSDKVSVIADFEFYPGIYTILGLLNGIQFVSFDTDRELTSGEDLIEELHKSNHKPNVIFISSNNFKKIWDGIMLKVYSRRFALTFEKYILTRWIINHRLNKELYTVFGKQVKKVHILNEELGYNVLDILKRSKIMFSSSYGFLEEGNFLAFKDPELFKHKNFIHKPGGTLLKDTSLQHPVILDKERGYCSPNTKLELGEICVIKEIGQQIVKAVIPSGDLGVFLPNISNQGDRPFLYVYAKRDRQIGVSNTVPDRPSLDLTEKSIKDTWLIRDCFLKPYRNEIGWEYKLFFEIREDLLDARNIPWENIIIMLNQLVEEVNRNTTIKISSFGIINFNGMRNVVAKIQHYNT